MYFCRCANYIFDIGRELAISSVQSAIKMDCWPPEMASQVSAKQPSSVRHKADRMKSTMVTVFLLVII